MCRSRFWVKVDFSYQKLSDPSPKSIKILQTSWKSYKSTILLLTIWAQIEIFRFWHPRSLLVKLILVWFSVSRFSHRTQNPAKLWGHGQAEWICEVRVFVGRDPQTRILRHCLARALVLEMFRVVWPPTATRVTKGAGFEPQLKPFTFQRSNSSSILRKIFINFECTGLVRVRFGPSFRG